jgi:hypothetical protein
MDMNLSATPKKKQANAYNDSLLESLRGLGSGVKKTVTNDVVRGISGDVMMSLLGATPKSGELKPNEPINIPDKTHQPEYAPVAPLFRRPEYRPQIAIPKEDPVILKQQIDAVRSDIKAIASSLKSLDTEIQKTITEVPVNPGIYHKNFFERLRSILKALREQIDDSRSWLSLTSSRKQKKQYWGMYKKHGTQFGLSSERTMATQAG